MYLNDEAKPRKKRKRSVCECCFTKKDDFKPDLGARYICLKEFEIFENTISLNGGRHTCFWKNPGFKRIEKDGG